MSKLYRTNMIEGLCEFKKTADFEDIYILCQGVRVLQVFVTLFQYPGHFSAAVGASVKVRGSIRKTSAGTTDFDLPSSKISVGGPTLSLSGSTVSFTGGVLSESGVITIEDPPDLVGIIFGASTYPSVDGEAAFAASACWR